MATIWYNVSASIHWNKPATGIIRTELQILNYLKKIYKENFQECVWYKKRFVPKDYYLSVAGIKDDGLYEIGETMSFGQDDARKNQAYKVHGWSHAESDFTWTEGSEAILKLKLSRKPKKDCTLCIDALPYLRRGHTFQHVTVFANDIPVAEWHITQHGKFCATIPCAQLQSDDFVLRFVIPNSCSPRENEGAHDDRKLGMAVYSMTIDEVDVKCKNNVLLRRWGICYKKYKKVKSVDHNIKDISHRIEERTLFNEGDVLIDIGPNWDYAPQMEMYNLRKRGVKVITICYDLIPLLYRQYCIPGVSERFAEYVINCAEVSDVILCISEQTKNDLITFINDTGAKMPRLEIAILGDNVVDGLETKNEYVLELCKEKFILFVSTIERRKNHATLYKAYHILRSQKKELPKLVFVGGKGWGVNDLMNDIENDPLVDGDIIILHGLDDGALNMLYRHALFCVNPSYYEGWGLPVGEALSSGKVVLSSNAGSLPEVGGDLVEYASPWNPEEWAEKIDKLVTDRGYLKSLELKVRQNYKPRRWEDTALTIHNIISTINNV